VFNSVKEITNFLGISESAFSKEFIKYFHLGPKKLLSILKLRYAIFLMKNSEMKLKEIVYSVGFKDAHRFNESFHNLLGLSPTEFKKNHSENDFSEIRYCGKELLFSQKSATKTKFRY
jgi:AraC-like DNA-binding protein